MPFKDTKEGQTHYQNDNCGEPDHNNPIITQSIAIAKKYGQVVGRTDELYITLKQLDEILENI